MSTRFIDNMIALRIIHMLITPFSDTPAFHLGLIDATGKKIKEPTTEQEKDAYDYLNRLVFNMKKIINRMPGGENKIKNLVAALFLVKESYRHNIEYVSEEELYKITQSDVILAEETIQYHLYCEEGEGGGAIVNQGQVTASTEPTNKTGAITSTDIPVIRKKKPAIVRRQDMTQIAVTQNKGY